jgi:hypothetical protein
VNSAGQILLPIVNLIQNASQVVENVIHEIGHQMLEQILVLSAEQVAGGRTRGKASGEVRHLRIAAWLRPTRGPQDESEKPRLRHKTQGELRVPVY